MNSSNKKVLALIDSFKGTISSKEIGNITKFELEKKGLICKAFPISDGGDGFLECLLDILPLEVIKVKVNDPFFRIIDSYYLYDEKNQTAYIEMALASGINLLKEDELNPFLASTYGVGELIIDALNKNAKKIIIGLGGSATNDCGVGLLEALGVKFYHDDKLLNHLNCDALDLITRFDASYLKEKTKNTEFIVLSDVKNPLLGKSGATYMFSMQKGAKHSDLEILENKVSSFATLVDEIYKKENRHYLGTGAAGGLGFCLKAFFDAKFYQGINYILDLLDFDNFIDDFDYIITGEGKIDSQSLLGKVVFEVVKRAKGKKVILVCAVNTLSSEELKEFGIYKLFSIVPTIASTNESINDPKKYYRLLCQNIDFSE